MERKVHYQAGREPTDADRWNRLIGDPSQILYLLALRHLGENREIHVRNHQELVKLIGYGGEYSNGDIIAAVRDWHDVGLVSVPDETDGIRRIVFHEHELMDGVI